MKYRVRRDTRGKDTKREWLLLGVDGDPIWQSQPEFTGEFSLPEAAAIRLALAAGAHAYGKKNYYYFLEEIS